MKLVTRLLAVSALLLLAACGSTPNRYLPAKALNEIKSTQIVVVIPQQEIVAEIEQSNVAAAGGGGLLLALVDVAIEANRASTAEELLQPIKNSLVELSFNDLFKQALEAEIAKVNWLKASHIEVAMDVEKDMREKYFSAANTDAVVFVDAGYSLSPDFSAVKANASLTMLPKAEALKVYAEKGTSKKAQKYAWHMDNNIYRDQVAVSNSVANATHELEQNAEYLAATPAVLKTTFITMAESLAKRVVESLQTTAVEVDEQPAS